MNIFEIFVKNVRCVTQRRESILRFLKFCDEEFGSQNYFVNGQKILHTDYIISKSIPNKMINVFGRYG
jgi:hypothetical protein